MQKRTLVDSLCAMLSLGWGQQVNAGANPVVRAVTEDHFHYADLSVLIGAR